MQLPLTTILPGAIVYSSSTWFLSGSHPARTMAGVIYRVRTSVSFNFFLSALLPAWPDLQTRAYYATCQFNGFTLQSIHRVRVKSRNPGHPTQDICQHDHCVRRDLGLPARGFEGVLHIVGQLDRFDHDTADHLVFPPGQWNPRRSGRSGALSCRARARPLLHARASLGHKPCD